MNRRQLLARTAVGGAVWVAPSVLVGSTAFAVGSTTTTTGETGPTAGPNLVLNSSFEAAAAYTPAPNWSFA